MDNCKVCQKPVNVICQRGSGYCSQLCDRRDNDPNYEQLAARFAQNEGN